MRKIIQSVLGYSGLEQLSVFFGYLRMSGWTKSLFSKSPVNGDGSPLPWYTYPSIHFLDTRIEQASSELLVFEFGSGNSTLWWAQRAKQVVSVEDNRQWYSTVAAVKPVNVIYNFADDEKSYLECLSNYPGGFQVIVVDGSYREKCIEIAKSKLTVDGVLVIDNSDWNNLRHPIQKLLEKGFKELEFNGIGPCNGHPWSTSIIYREGNFLRI